jgi:hypothetical protein
MATPFSPINRRSPRAPWTYLGSDARYWGNFGLTQCDLTKWLILGRTAHDHTITRAQTALDLRYIRAESPILYLYWSCAGLIGVQAVQQTLRRRQRGSRNINRILNRHNIDPSRYLCASLRIMRDIEGHDDWSDCNRSNLLWRINPNHFPGNHCNVNSWYCTYSARSASTGSMAIARRAGR